jgi:hypothetical protein
MAATSDLTSAPRGQRRLEKFRGLFLVAAPAAMATFTAVVVGATFGPVRYDPQGDQLIVAMIYDGTNPNHHFSIKWDTCRMGEQLDQPAHQTIGVNLLDDDHDDAGKTTYTETIKVPLASLACRPATVTLWTPPNFTTSVDIPARR